MSASVSVCPCLSASLSPKPHVKSSSVFVHVTYGDGLVIFCRCCNMFLPYVGDIMFAYVMARNRRREEAYIRSQPAGGSTHSMLRHILRLTYERQHLTGGGICCLRLISPAGRATAANFVTAVVYSGKRTDGRKPDRCIVCCFVPLRLKCGSVAEWLACWAQAQKGPGSNRSRDAVG